MQEEHVRPFVVDELRYIGTLWRMYTDRVCPVPPLWLAPYPYSPATFTDTLIGGDTRETLAYEVCMQFEVVQEYMPLP